MAKELTPEGRRSLSLGTISRCIAKQSEHLQPHDFEWLESEVREAKRQRIAQLMKEGGMQLHISGLNEDGEFERVPIGGTA